MKAAFFSKCFKKYKVDFLGAIPAVRYIYAPKPWEHRMPLPSGLGRNISDLKKL